MSISPRPRRLTVVDLFSGCGGMSSGFRARSDRFQIVGAVDRQVAKPSALKSNGSTHCNATYEHNIGFSPKEADLAALDPGAYRSELGLVKGALDVMISCAPCTGFSQKNARNHLEDDPRNSLVQRTAEFVREFMPSYLVMENVKELLIGVQLHHFRYLADRLRELGYDVASQVHDLSEFGLPQRRLRALIVARREGRASVPFPRRHAVRTVRDAIGHLPPIEAGGVLADDPMHRSPGMGKVTLARLRAIPRDGGSWADVMNDPELTGTAKHRLLTPAMFTARPGSFPDIYGRLWWDRPAITVTRECGHVGNGRYSHPEQDRLVSVREMALLQGFPADFVFHGPLSAKYNQIGDAVPPMISRIIAEHVLALQDEELQDRPNWKGPDQAELPWPLGPCAHPSIADEAV